MAERINFTTLDGIKIVGTWVPATTVIGAVVLLHQMPDTRIAWSDVQSALAQRNIASLAIDLRGHGESTESTAGETFDYREFTDADHQTSLLDITAAIDWIGQRGIDRERMTLAGASIGANLALQALTGEPRLAGAGLLSPGDYRGINAVADMGNLVSGQAVLIVSSEDDKQSFAASQSMFEQAPTDTDKKKFVVYKKAGHGMHMLQVERGLRDTLADWLAETIRG